MNTFAKSFLSLSLGLGLAASVHAQSAAPDAHKLPAKVEAPKAPAAPKVEAAKPAAAKLEAAKPEAGKLEAKAHEAGKHAKAKATDKLPGATPEKVAAAPATPKELKPTAAQAAPTAAKVLPKPEVTGTKPVK